MRPFCVRLVLGLGNPGPRYAGTRHNVGFLVAEALARRHRVPLDQTGFSSVYGQGRVRGVPVVIAKPMTFMNRSGEAAADLLRHFDGNREDMIVVHDDMDLPFGRIKIKEKGGHGGHNGLRSLMDAVGGGEFLRLRVGIGRPLPEQDATDHVLAAFGENEQQAVSDLLSLSADALETVLAEGVRIGMNRYNNKQVTAGPEEAGKQAENEPGHNSQN